MAGSVLLVVEAEGYPLTAQWVWKLSRGIDEDKVQDRPLAKSIACG